MSIEDGMELDGDIVDSLYDPTEDTPDKIDLDDLLEEKPKKKKRKGETNQRQTRDKPHKTHPQQLPTTNYNSLQFQ